MYDSMFLNCSYYCPKKCLLLQCHQKYVLSSVANVIWLYRGTVGIYNNNNLFHNKSHHNLNACILFYFIHLFIIYLFIHSFIYLFILFLEVGFFWSLWFMFWRYIRYLYFQSNFVINVGASFHIYRYHFIFT